MADKQIKLKVFTSQNELYMKMLLELRTKIGWSKDEKYGEPIFSIPFILTCAAALECALNDYIITHFSSENDELIPGYLSMSLRGKLTNIVPLLTDGQYKINTEHKTYKTLVELIRVRNRLVHNKSDYEECEGTVVTAENGDIHIKIPDEVNEKLDDYYLGVKPPIGRFQDALEDLYEKFLYARPKTNFPDNHFIVRVKHA